MSERAPIDLPRLPPRSSRPSRGRQAAVAAAVLAAMAAAAGVGAALASRDDDEQALPTPSPSAAAPVTPSAAAPSPSPRPPSPRPSPSPSTDSQGRILDGEDVGYLRSISSDGSSLQLDRIILLTGEAAEAEAVRRGEEVLDYLIVNDNPRLREYALDPEAPVTLSIRLAPEDTKDGSSSVPSSVAELRQQLERLPDVAATTPFELVVRDGRVVALDEIYLP